MTTYSLRNNKSLFSLPFLVLFLISNLYGLDKELVLSIDSLSSRQSIPLEYVGVLIDESTALEVEDLTNKAFQDFSHLPNYQNRKVGAKYWFKIDFHNPQAVENSFWLGVQADYVYAYLVHASGKVDRTQAGMMLPYKDKTVQIIKKRAVNLLPLHLEAGEKASLYLQSKYTGLHLNPSKIDFFPTIDSARLKILENEKADTFNNGFFQAILLIIFLYCLFFTIYAKQKYSLYLTIYCLFYSLYFFNSDGQLYQYTSISDFPLIRNHLNLNLLNLGMAFDLLFMTTYLNLKNRLPFWNKIYNGIIITALIVSFSSAYYYYSTEDYKTALSLVSLFQLFYLLPRTIFLGRIWLIKDFKLRIFALAWTVGHLFVCTAWLSYFYPVDGYLLLKVGIGAYLSIIVLSFSYFAAKSSTDNLVFEKEAAQKELELEKQRLQQETTEKEKILLQQKTTKLQQLDNLKSRFFANVSHELRTPLTLILAPLDSVLKRKRLESKDYNFLMTAKQSGKQLLGLVNEILDLSKLEKSKLTVVEKPIELHYLLNIILANFESLAQSKGVQLRLDYRADTTLQINLDKGKFEKVINNLLTNALKFTSKGDQVKVVLEESSNTIQLKVLDSGRGIHPEDLPHIFDRYFQTNQMNGVAEGGTGIGLALSLELAKVMKGQLWVESELGVGSTFFFKFPKKEVFEVPIIPQKEPLIKSLEEKEELIIALENKIPLENSNKPKPHLLIVEDNPSLRSYLTTILADTYQVQTAINGQVAFDRLKALIQNKQTLPHLILSDIMMPVMDGFQFLEKVKSTDHLRSIPVIMLTARAELKDKLKALRIGVDDYLTKPFEQEELFARVENLLKHAAQKVTVIPKGNLALPTTAKATMLSQKDLKWLEELEQIVSSKIAIIGFSADDLAATVQLSRRQLGRRVKQYTGLTASNYIKEARLNRARDLIGQRKVDSVKHVAIEVGFLNIDYFGQQYKERFGKLPSEYF